MAQDVAKIQALLSTWNAAKKTKASAELAEKNARTALIDYAFPNLEEGSGNKVDVGYDKVLQVTGVINRKLDMSALEALKPTVAPDVIDAIVRTKYELSVSSWKALPNSVRLQLASAVEEGWGSHQVKIIDKK